MVQIFTIVTPDASATIHARIAGGFVPAIMSLGLGFFSCEQSAAAIAVMTIAVTFIGCLYGAGVMVNHADVAPKYASLLFGISNTFATLPGFLAPIAIGKLTTNVSTCTVCFHNHGLHVGSCGQIFSVDMKYAHLYVDSIQMHERQI